MLNPAIGAPAAHDGQSWLVTGTFVACKTNENQDAWLQKGISRCLGPYAEVT